MDNPVITEIIMPFFVALFMFAMGALLRVSDFKQILDYPKAAFLGIANQLLFVPFIGFAAIWLFPLSTDYAIGLMILAACPGGAISNLLALLAGGNVALSISLTSVSTFAGVITIPFWTGLAFEVIADQNNTTELPVGESVITLLSITIVPILLGMLFRRYQQAMADRLEGPVKKITGIYLVILIGGLLFKERHQLGLYLSVLGPAVAFLNIATMSFGGITARLFRLPRADTITLILETGIQNALLGITYAAILKAPDMAFPSAVYGLFMYMASAAIILGTRVIFPAPATPGDGVSHKSDANAPG